MDDPKPWVMPFLKLDLDRYAQNVALQVSSGDVGPGYVCDKLAAKVREYVGAYQVVLTSSGTTALVAALLAAGRMGGWDRETKVIVPAYGMVATVNAVIQAGFVPVLADVGAGGCLDESSLETVLGELGSGAASVRAVVFVNFGGYTPEYLRELVDQCAARGLVLIEDAACGLGHWQGNKHAGTFGLFGTLSFSPHKVVTAGQGGAVLCRSDAAAEAVEGIVHHGRPDRFGAVSGWGTNFRMSQVNAALALAQFPMLEAVLHYRAEQCSLLEQVLTNDDERVSHLVRWMSMVRSGPPAFNLVQTADSSTALALYGLLVKQRIDARMQYKPLYEYRHVTNKHSVTSSFPCTRKWAHQTVFLPFGGGFTLDDIGLLARQVVEAWKQVRRGLGK